MKIAIIIAPKDFRDEEFFVPYNYFREKGYSVEVFSTKKGIAKGKLGGEFEVKHLIDELRVDDFNAIVFVGGPGTPIVRDYEKVYEKIKEANEKGKLIAAICWSPTILAKSGILKGKKATVWFGNDFEGTTKDYLEKYGAVFTGKDVERDGDIITANGPRAALDYAKEIEKALKEKLKQ